MPTNLFGLSIPGGDSHQITHDRPEPPPGCPYSDLLRIRAAGGVEDLWLTSLAVDGVEQLAAGPVPMTLFSSGNVWPVFIDRGKRMRLLIENRSGCAISFGLHLA